MSGPSLVSLVRSMAISVEIVSKECGGGWRTFRTESIHHPEEPDQRNFSKARGGEMVHTYPLLVYAQRENWPWLIWISIRERHFGRTPLGP